MVEQKCSTLVDYSALLVALSFFEAGAECKTPHLRQSFELLSCEHVVLFEAMQVDGFLGELKGELERVLVRKIVLEVRVASEEADDLEAHEVGG